MKLSKILVLTMVAMLLLVGAAMADQKTNINCSVCNGEVWEHYEDSTCTAQGQWYTYCINENCTANDNHIDSGFILKKVHPTKDNWVPGMMNNEDYQAATCTKDEIVTGNCVNCGESVTLTLSEAYGHDWNNGYTLTSPASCTANGRATVECANGCGAVEKVVGGTVYTDTYLKAVSEMLKATGHDHGTGTWDLNTTDATCTSAAVDTSTCPNKWEQLDGSKKDCGDVVTREGTDKGGHVFTDWKIDKAPTCETKGSMTRHCTRAASKCDEYNWISKTPYTEIVDIDPLGHDWDNGAVETAADCKTGTAGVMKFVCNACADTKTEPIAAEHTWGEWQTTEKGELRICDNCGAIEFKADAETPVTPETPDTDDDTTTGGTTTGGNSSSSSTSGVEIPATGDASIAWAYIMVAASAIVLVAMKKRATNN